MTTEERDRVLREAKEYAASFNRAASSVPHCQNDNCGVRRTRTTYVLFRVEVKLWLCDRCYLQWANVTGRLMP